MDDTDVSELDPGIRETVLWLNTNEFTTVDSGDGHSKTDMECAMGQPNVAIKVDPIDLIRECDRLAKLLHGRGIQLSAINDDGDPQIQASYDPGNGIALILLMCVDDAKLGLT